MGDGKPSALEAKLCYVVLHVLTRLGALKPYMYIIETLLDKATWYIPKNK